MKTALAIIVMTPLSFGLSLLLGLFVFLTPKLLGEFYRTDEKLVYFLNLPGSVVFMTGAGVVIFCIPGLITAAGSAALLVSRYGTKPEIGLFGSGVFGFVVFKGYFLLCKLLHVAGGLTPLNQLACGLAALGFGLSALVFSICWPGGLLQSPCKLVSFSARCKSGLLYRIIPALIIFLGVIGYYFHVYPL